MSRVYAILFGAILLMAGAAALLGTGWLPLPSPPVRAKPASPAAAAATTADDGTVLTLTRDSAGHFLINAEVNGNDARFLIDTGADVVAIGEAEADRLGVHYDPAGFTASTQTAAGTGMGQHVTIDTLTIAGSEFHDLDAVVAQGLETNLLGQSVLRKLGKVELSGDKMTIRAE